MADPQNRQSNSSSSEFVSSLRGIGKNVAKAQEASTSRFPDLPPKAVADDLQLAMNDAINRYVGRSDETLLEDNLRSFGSGFVSIEGSLKNIGITAGEHLIMPGRISALINNWSPEELAQAQQNVRRKATELRLDSANKSIEVGQNIKKGQSFVQQQANDIYQRDLDARIAANRDQEENPDARGFIPGVRRFAKDAASTFDAISENPSAASSLISEATGSVLPSFVPTAAVGTALRAVGVGQKVVNGAVAGTVGLQEGMGAYNSVAVSIADTPVDELYKTSDEFRYHVNRGEDPIKARLDLANSAGTDALQLQTLMGTLFGLGVARFEGNPIQGARFNGPAASAIKQGFEEAAQGASGQFSENVAMQRRVNPNQDLSEGTGTAAIEGALGGIGAGYALGYGASPLTVADTVVNAAEFTQTNVRKVTDPIVNPIKDAFKRATGQVVDRTLNSVSPETNTEAETPAEPTRQERVFDPKYANNDVQVEENTPADIHSEKRTNTQTKIENILSGNVDTQSSENNAEDADQIKNRDQVRSELLFDGRNDNRYGNVPSFKELTAQTVKGFSQIERDPKDRLAAQVLNSQGKSVSVIDTSRRLGNLVQHQINKYEAGLKSLETGEPVYYDTLDPRDGKTFIPAGSDGARSILVNSKNKESLQTLQMIAEDTNKGISAYNALREDYSILLDKFDQERSYKNVEVPSFEPNLEQRLPQNQSEGASDVKILREKRGRVGEGKSPQQRLAEETTEAIQKARQETTSETDGILEKTRNPVKSLDLVKGKNGRSIFHEAHKIKSDNQTPRTLQRSLPEIIEDVENEPEGENTVINYPMDEGARQLVQNVENEVQNFVEGMNKQLQSRLKITYGSKGPTREELLRNPDNDLGVTLSEQQQGRVLATVDAESLNEGSDIKYNDTLLRGALYATLDTLLNEPLQGSETYKDRDILDALGLPKDERVTPEMRKALAYGVTARTLKERLAKNIRNFWGVSPAKSDSASSAKGISEAMAEEIMQFLTENPIANDREVPWLEKKQFNIQGTGIDRTPRQPFSYRVDPKGAADAGIYKTIIRDLALPNQKHDRTHAYVLGKPDLSAIPETFQKNKSTALSEKKKEAIRTQMQTEFRVSPSMLSFVETYGREALETFLGVREFDEEKPANINHQLSVEGKNRSIWRGLDLAQEQVEQMQEYARDNEISFEEVPIFYNYTVSSNNRFQMTGYGPQSDKIARELFTSTFGNKIDLGKEIDSPTLDYFKAAVLQAIDNGLKIENLGLTESVRQMEQLVLEKDAPFRPAIDTLKEDGDGAKFYDLLNKAVAATGAEPSMRLLKALIETASLEQALDAGKDSFETDLPIELDGKTHGPISMTIQHSVGKLTEGQLRTFQRGGMFINSSSVEGSNTENFGQFGGIDFYEAVANEMTSQIEEAAKYYKDTDPDEASRMGLVLSILKDVGHVSIQKGETGVEFSIKRKGTKNPITQYIYGAGTKSISAGLAREISNKLYELITEALQSESDVDLLRFVAKLDRLYPNVGLADQFRNMKPKELADYTIDADLFSDLRYDIQQRYGIFFKKSMDKTIGKSVVAINELMLDASQQMATIYQDLIVKSLDAERERLIKEGELRKGDHLPEAVVERIIDSHRKYAPVIHGEQITLDLASMREGVTRRHRSVALDGRKSDSSTPTPKDVGVSILPLIAQANSDVQMITSFMADATPELAQGLAVHDGYETGIANIPETANALNKAVAEAWQINTVEPVAKAVEELIQLSNDPALKDYQTEIAALEKTAQRLRNAAIYRQARIDVLANLEINFDGVPGAEVPFKQNGEVLSIDEINAKIEQRNKELQAKRKKSTDVFEFEKEDPEGSSLRQELENTDYASTDGRVFLEVLRANIEKNGSAGQKQVMKQLYQSSTLKQIMEDGLNIEITPLGQLPLEESDVGGQYKPLSNTLVLHNVTGETALHELVHVATMGSVVAHYEGDQSNDAVKRLEDLMNDFRSREYTGSPNMGTALHLQNELDRIEENHLDNPKEASIIMLQEFLAWNLSNQQLINAAQSTDTKAPLSQLRTMGKKVLAAMRKILGFSSTKVFDHIRFNSDILMNDRAFSYDGPLVFNQNTDQNSPNNSEMESLFDDKITAFLEDPASFEDLNGEIVDPRERFAESQVSAERALQRYDLAGFSIDEGKTGLFRKMHAAIQLHIDSAPDALLESQRFVEALLENISQENMKDWFNENVESEPEDPQRRVIHDQRIKNALSVLNGVSFPDVDNPGNVLAPELNEAGISDRLAGIIALSQSSDTFRSFLNSLGPETAKKVGKITNTALPKDATLDDYLDSFGDVVIEKLSSRITNKDASIADNLDVLANAIAEANYEKEVEKNFAARAVDGGLQGLNKADKAIDTAINNLSDKVSDAVSGGEKDRSIVLAPIRIMADIAHTEKVSKRASEVTSFLNDPRVPHVIRDMWTEVLQITGNPDDPADGGNAAVFMLVQRAKQFVSRVRETYRKDLPKILQNQFQSEIEKEDYTKMFDVFAKTDITSLFSSLGRTAGKHPKFMDLVGSSSAHADRRKEQIQKYEDRLKKEISTLNIPKGLQDALFTAYKTKSRQLATFMVTGQTGPNTLKNADAIARLLNEDGYTLTKAQHDKFRKVFDTAKDRNGAMGRTFVSIRRNIDTLVSLEALDQTDPATMDRIEQIYREDPEAIQYMLDVMRDLRRQERNKILRQSKDVGVSYEMARANMYKGYIGTPARKGRSVVIAGQSRKDDLERMGYTAVREYKGPEADYVRKAEPEYIFVSKHASPARYNQGALQTVQDSLSGSDPRTGQSLGNHTAGMISGDAALNLNRIFKRHTKSGFSSGDGMPMFPIFGPHGQVYGFERVIPLDVQAMLEPNQDITQAIGNWAGRIVEEKAAEGFNQSLIDFLYGVWENREEGSDNEFVSLDPESPDMTKDPILRDSARLIPFKTRQYAATKFNGPIRIRRDMVNNSLGYRSASVSDFFTGQSRHSEKVTQTGEKVMRTIFFFNPNSARKYATLVEGATQTVVSEVKHAIVVKSGVILAANTMSNVLQLMMRGVSPTVIEKDTRKMFDELTQYKKNETKKIQLQADMLATRDTQTRARIKSRIKAIEDSEARMTIAPLIEAGMLSTVSEGLTGADEALINGRFMEWIENKAGELPGPLSTAARYAIMARDTSLYKGLSRGVQYSDFIAKSIYYKHLTQEQGMSPSEAITKVSQEFINYDLLEGRNRGYAESIGLIWFWNFKLRSMKIGLNIARENPATALFSMYGINELLSLDVGTVIGDNWASALIDGRLGYSVGPGMVGAAIDLNVWKNLVS